MNQLGVVIPTLNEGRLLSGLLQDLRELELPVQLIIADGGSNDDTLAVADAAGARVLIAPRGRASQMNAGARVVAGNWLCFLHADVRLPPRARADLTKTMNDSATGAAVWRLAIDARGWWFRTLERGARLRDRLAGLPYGDQGLLVRREIFDEVGGFPEIPVMEDVAMVRALRRETPLHHLPSSVLVSSRRWHREGPYRVLIRNTLLVTAYLAGVPAHRLARWYHPEGA